MSISLRFKQYATGFMLAVILLLGLQMRLQVAVQTEVDTPVRADAYDYFAYAYNLRHFFTYSRGSGENPVPDAGRPPAYPVFLALFLDKKIAVTDFLERVYLAQALLSCLSILLVYLIFQMIAGRVAGLFTAALTALSPHLINMNMYLLSETLFTFLLLLCLWVLARGLTQQHARWLFIAGVLLAAAVLTRAWLQYFVFLGALFLFLVMPRRMALSLLLGFSVLFALWIVRNSVSLDQAGTSQVATSLYHGSFPGFMYQNRPETFGFPYAADPRAEIITQSVGTALTEIYRHFQEDFWTYFHWYAWGKAEILLSWNIVAGMGDVFVYPVIYSPYQNIAHLQFSHSLMRAAHTPLMLLALAGLVLAWLPGLQKLRFTLLQVIFIRLLALLIMYFIAVHIILAPFPRYAIPMRPLMYGFALFSLVYAWRWLALGLNRSS
jgi:4-amino-4-deoxy-L-arabinose transferase-like glycosyltransferase